MVGVSGVSYLYVCNTSSDYISKVNLESLSEENKIFLGLKDSCKIGPHDICTYEDKLLTANNYSNTLSIISVGEEKEVENYFIGMHCNSIAVCDNNAYISCGELDSLLVFNLTKKKVTEKIPCGSFPHSVRFDRDMKKIIVSNMHSDSITLIDCCNRENPSFIESLHYPTKAIFTEDGKYILVCESNMGICTKGTLNIIEVESLKTVGKLKVGNSPVDIFCEGNECFITNFGDGTVSRINLKQLKESDRIKVGGMPRGIIKIENHLYIGDNFNNLLIEYNLEKGRKKVITIGGEPTGMTLC